MDLLKDLYEVKDLGKLIPELTTEVIDNGGYKNWRKLVDVKFSRTKGLNIIDKDNNEIRDLLQRMIFCIQKY